MTITNSMRTLKNILPRIRKCNFSSSSDQTIGFIGLGNMGAPMVNNLIKNKKEVLVFDLSKEALKKAESNGARSCDSPAEVASRSRVVISMLPSSAHVTKVFQEKNGVFSSVQKDSLLIDSSTIDPAVSKELEKDALERGAHFFDAPVSGGVTGARDGTLTFMVGGNKKFFPKAEEVLLNMGKNIVYCGPAGTGEAAKLCNNMLLAISMIGTAEALTLAHKLGLDPKLMTSILNTSTGQCWSTLKYNPCPGVMEGVPSANDYEGGFGSALMAKDLGLAQNSATATLTPSFLGASAHQIYKTLCSQGLGLKDFGVVYKFLQEKKQ